MAIHVHVGGKTITIAKPAKARDAEKFTQVELEDLAERFLAALAKVGHKSVDEEEGHPFHGNQYTEVAGATKPDKVTVAGVKKGVHELLSSGHPFSVEELKSITGAKLTQQIHNAITELKAGKGGLGLTLEKVGGHYQVVKAAQEAQKAATSPTPPAPAPVAAPSPVSASPDGLHVPAPAVLLTHEQADAKYQKSMSGVFAEVGILEQEEGAQYFKDQKALHMAHWKAGVTGKAQTVVKQQVFPEDLAFAAGLQGLEDEGFDEASDYEWAANKLYTKWKSDTAAAKTGTKHITPLAKETKTSSPPPSNPTTFTQAAKTNLRPAGSANIDADQVKSQTWRDKMVSNITKVRNLMGETTKAAAVPNKIEVEKKLSARLAGSAEFSDMSAKRPGLVRHLVARWASSSGDHHDDSVALQLAVRDEFGMSHDEVETKALGSLSLHDSEKSLLTSARNNISPGVDLETFKTGLRHFVRAQYDETQAYFKSAGVAEVTLVRGTTVKGPDKPEIAKVKLQPASSFSTHLGIAKRFAGDTHAQLLFVRVPVTQLLGSFKTGFGCTDESELIVMHHKDTQALVMKPLHSMPTVKASLELAANHL